MVSRVKLVVALGNPGSQYTSTRHNAGVWLLDRLLSQFSLGLEKTKICKALCASVCMDNQDIRFLFPQSFMNNSGQEVGKFMRYFNIHVDELLVLHDELDFVPGIVRLKKGGGCAGHNGLKSIKAHIGSADFVRIRIGIGHPGNSNEVSSYVLKKPSVSDRLSIDKALTVTEDIMPALLTGDLSNAMKQLNTNT